MHEVVQIRCDINISIHFVIIFIVMNQSTILLFIYININYIKGNKAFYSYLICGVCTWKEERKTQKILIIHNIIYYIKQNVDSNACLSIKTGTHKDGATLIF